MAPKKQGTKFHIMRVIKTKQLDFLATKGISSLLRCTLKETKPIPNRRSDKQPLTAARFLTLINRKISLILIYQRLFL